MVSCANLRLRSESRGRRVVVRIHVRGLCLPAAASHSGLSSAQQVARRAGEFRRARVFGRRRQGEEEREAATGPAGWGQSLGNVQRRLRRVWQTSGGSLGSKAGLEARAFVPSVWVRCLQGEVSLSLDGPTCAMLHAACSGPALSPGLAASVSGKTNGAGVSGDAFPVPPSVASLAQGLATAQPPTGFVEQQQQRGASLQKRLAQQLGAPAAAEALSQLEAQSQFRAVADESVETFLREAEPAAGAARRAPVSVSEVRLHAETAAAVSPPAAASLQQQAAAASAVQTFPEQQQPTPEAAAVASGAFAPPAEVAGGEVAVPPAQTAVPSLQESACAALSRLLPQALPLPGGAAASRLVVAEGTADHALKL